MALAATPAAPARVWRVRWVRYRSSLRAVPRNSGVPPGGTLPRRSMTGPRSLFSETTLAHPSQSIVCVQCSPGQRRRQDVDDNGHPPQLGVGDLALVVEYDPELVPQIPGVTAQQIGERRGHPPQGHGRGGGHVVLVVGDRPGRYPDQGRQVIAAQAGPVAEQAERLARRLGTEVRATLPGRSEVDDFVRI